MTKLNSALRENGITQLALGTGSVKLDTRAEVGIDLAEIPDSSLLVLFRYGVTRKANDVVNSAWAARKHAVEDGKAEAIDEKVFRQQYLDDFAALVKSGDWSPTRQSGISYEVKATRFVLGAWLRNDKMNKESLKKIANHEGQLWQTVTRRGWLNLARQSMTEEELKEVDLVVKVDEKMDETKAAFKDMIDTKAAQLKAADEAVPPTTNLISGVTL